MLTGKVSAIILTQKYILSEGDNTDSTGHGIQCPLCAQGPYSTLSSSVNRKGLKSRNINNLKEK